MVEDCKDKPGMWRKSKNVDGKSVHTRSGGLWHRMNSRCKVGGRQQSITDAYNGCETSENFKCFQFFTDWCHRQIGYGNTGWDLDKDILASGSKVYSEDSCVFVPHNLNMFLASQERRGKKSTGVHVKAETGKYVAQISVEGRRKQVGSYNTEAAAIDAYKDAKEAEAFRWYLRFEAGEFTVDPRVTERMRLWSVQ